MSARAGPVVLLAGGTGGAKLARGLLDVVAPDELVVIANTGDDIEIYGGYVSPDPDLITFRLGDRDLAIALERARALKRGARLTEAHTQLTQALGVSAGVLPMSDQPVRTRVLAQGRWWPFQEFMIAGHGSGPVEDVELKGAREAKPTPEVLAAIAGARAIIIGPSNPFVSIEPILATGSIRQAIRRSPAPVVAVSPLVDGKVLKGPTDVFMQWAQLPLSSDGIATVYAGVIDGLVADQRTDLVPTLQAPVLIDNPRAGAELAERTLGFAAELL